MRKKKKPASSPRRAIPQPPATAIPQPPADQPPSPAEQPWAGPPCPVVGIGSSAGGLPALREFFHSVPADSGLAFVLVHHLDPKHKSHMADVLQRHTPMRVEAAAHGVSIAPNVVYTIPSNAYIGIHHCVLSLSAPNPKAGAPRMPIDFFFRALAEDCGDKAIAILLSGSGSDGTIGLREIRGAGGLTFVQDPATAEYSSMPESAIINGLADHVQSPAEIGTALVNIAQRTQALAAADAAREDEAAQLNAVLSLVAVRTRSDFRPYKRSTIVRRVRRQMSLHRIDSLPEYLKFLRANPEKVAQLAHDMLIGVTSFFRDGEPWEELRREVIAPMVAHHEGEEPVRIWVPGCATGEEAYSLAIVLADEMAAQRRTVPVQIFASDIDENALRTARTGVYSENIVADVNPARLARRFMKVHEGYQIEKQPREWLTFAVQNLISDPPFSRLDLIVCRNVLIYFDAEAQRRVIALFAYALNAGGYLFLGKSDTIAGEHELFEVVSSKHHIYRRTRSLRTDLGRFPMPIDRTYGVRPAGLTHRLRSSTLAALNQGVLLKHFQAAVILVDRSGTILHFFGDTDRYVQHPTGDATLNLLDMVREVVSTRLSAALAEAAEDKVVTIENVPMQGGGATRMVNVTVRRADERNHPEGVLAVIFEQVAEPQPVAAAPRDDAGEAESAPYVELIGRLRHTKEELQASIEELEMSNEELKAANEEVTSVNEELQSTNEELETSKEELQSLNEELTTVNNQLQEKVDQLATANSDLANLFTATELATVFLDQDMNIRRFTPSATDLLRLIPSDVGRPINDISHRFPGLDLAAAGAQVVRKLAAVEQQLHATDDRWFVMRVMPYRTSTDRIEGVVMTFHEVTALKQREEALRVATEQLAAEVQNHASKLQETRAALEEEMARREDLSRRLLRLQDEERQRIAGELHDSTAQNLAALAMLMGRLQKSERQLPAPMRASLTEGAELVQAVMREVRTVSYLLHPPLLEDVGLITALRGYVEGFCRRSGIRVDLDLAGDIGRVPLPVKTAVFRIMQECLNNVHRHSGSSNACVRLSRKGRALTLQVEDSGRGFPRGALNTDGDPVAHMGVGISAIQERLRQINGTLQIRSRRKKTLVIATVPLDRPVGGNGAPLRS